LARGKTAEASAKLDRIQNVLGTDSPEASVSATVTDTLNSAVVTKLRSQYLDLSNREAEWTARYGRNHLAAQRAGAIAQTSVSGSATFLVGRVAKH